MGRGGDRPPPGGAKSAVALAMAVVGAMAVALVVAVARVVARVWHIYEMPSMRLYASLVHASQNAEMETCFG